ncbi:beta-N-acetylhexosaminidase [Nitrincola nitratireducens]|uniref:Beta-hexosaminidase n=1 Tax=Nitrincola nitratireducens TaxID=1229521 RepID=W9UVB1_9GAMM|nr:beta-N-acetylhexosaminidase [Nitrincola nitratireducens]EXJ11183.1 Beta-hexosaminidase [Nitrincola nitratireducens]
MLDLVGTELSAKEASLLQNPRVGGLILFSRNYVNPDQLKQLIASIRAVAPNIIIAVDQEGGRVQRFKEGFTRLPAMSALGKLYDTSPDEAIHAAHELGWLMALELRAFDVDISFAPVLDLDWQQSSVIGDRAFSSSAERVALLSGAFLKGMHEAGMAATGKHFPGHGWVQADSHLELPYDERLESAIRQDDLQPFARLIEEGLDAIMPAHVVYSQVDTAPAGFSSYWLKDVLRQELGFDGVIFSDDLTMEGASIAGDYALRCQKALAAGCDMVLVCNQPEAALQVLEYLGTLPELDNPRIAKMRGNPCVNRDSLREDAARAIAAKLCQ